MPNALRFQGGVKDAASLPQTWTEILQTSGLLTSTGLSEALRSSRSRGSWEKARRLRASAELREKTSLRGETLSGERMHACKCREATLGVGLCSLTKPEWWRWCLQLKAQPAWRMRRQSKRRVSCHRSQDLRERRTFRLHATQQGRRGRAALGALPANARPPPVDVAGAAVSTQHHHPQPTTAEILNPLARGLSSSAGQGLTRG